MSWKKVKIYAPVGTKFGIVRNKNDEIEIVFKKEGEEYPYDLHPIGGEMTIMEGCKSYAVVDDV